jgi:hypothetical protein
MGFLAVFVFKGYTIFEKLYVSDTQAISGEITGLDSASVFKT